MRSVSYAVAVFAAAVFGFCAGCGGRTHGVEWHAAARVESGDARYDKGVSAMYAGVADGLMVIAGGANFPDVPAAEGGGKAFYDHIFVGDGETWHRAGSLPERAAYGVSFQCGDGVVIAGGTNESGPLRSVFKLNPYSVDSVSVTVLPPLPFAVEQAAGAEVGGWLCLFGGIADGKPSAELLAFDGEGWRRLTPAPEPMVQPVAASSGGRLYVWGGFDSAAKSAGGNGYCYDPQRDEWSAVAGHPDGGTFTGGCALTLGDGRILCTGGVDRGVFSAALTMPAERSREYLSQPIEAYRFQRSVRIFDPVSGEWNCEGESACTARAGASMLLFGGDVWLLGGELKPGVRTPENYCTSYFNR